MSGDEHDVTAGWIKGLESALASVESGAPDAAESARRIARVITRHLEGQTDDPVMQAAQKAEVADAASLPAALRTLADMLHFFPMVVRPSTGAAATVLIVDDDPIVRLSVTTAIEAPRREVIAASTAADARKILASRSVDLMILDLVLPDIDGRNFLVELREQPATASLPVFVLSAQSSHAAETECFSLGANEFITKPFDPNVLASSVTASLRAASTGTNDGTLDARTGLPNRSAIRERFRSDIDAMTRGGRNATLAIIDFSELRAIADTHGQTLADQVLRSTANTLHEALRGTGIVGRWGGDTFVAIFEGLDPLGAQPWLDRAMRRVRDTDFTDSAGKTFQTAFIAGLTAIRPEEPIDDVVTRADRLLVAAKRRGPGNIVSDTQLEALTIHRVLVAEDDVMTLRLIRHRLLAEGFEVTLCRDGEDALQSATNDPPDVIVTDVQMPRIDGFTLVSMLRKIPQTSRVPILILTALGKDSDIARGVDVGANDYMPKPFSPIELSSRIHRLLRRPL